MHTKKKEINVFTVGDSYKATTFSGVAYYFTQAFEQQGFKLNRINIAPNRYLEKLYAIYHKIAKSFITDKRYDFMRSQLNYFLVNRRIKKATSRFSNAAMDIFITFSFSSKRYTKRPVILFSDDVFERTIKTPRLQNDHFVKWGIEQERQNLQQADIVISFFPELMSYMKSRYQLTNIYYLGKVMNFAKGAVNETEMLKKKQSSNMILFIGRADGYLEGARLAVEAFRSVKLKNYELHIVGPTKEHFRDVEISPNITFYGYLRKHINEEFETYCNLIETAALFVNPTRAGGTYLTTLEVMQLYTPILIFMYNEFEKVFDGNYKDFCITIDKYDPEHLADAICSFMGSPKRKDMCISAHNAVKNFSWEHWIEEFLKILAVNNIFLNSILSFVISFFFQKIFDSPVISCVILLI